MRRRATTLPCGFRTLYVEVYLWEYSEITKMSKRFRTLYVEVYQILNGDIIRSDEMEFPYIIC